MPEKTRGVGFKSAVQNEPANDVQDKQRLSIFLNVSLNDSGGSKIVKHLFNYRLQAVGSIKTLRARACTDETFSGTWESCAKQSLQRCGEQSLNNLQRSK